MNYWLIVTSPDNFEITKERKFKVQGVKTRHRKKAERMAAGDVLMYYLTKKAAFAGICQIESGYFEDHAPIWTSPKKPDEHYPWRVKISPLLIPEDADQIPAIDLKDNLEYVSRYPAAHWRLAFQGNVHNLPKSDYEVIRNAIESAMTPVT